ncbi:hypothetical protein LguiA_002341 [Lonicera macranthoides]
MGCRGSYDFINRHSEMMFIRCELNKILLIDIAYMLHYKLIRALPSIEIYYNKIMARSCIPSLESCDSLGFACLKSDSATELQHEQLKEEVRKMIVGSSDELAQQLKLIDAIQRLGVFYHFESEIDVALKNHLVNFNDSFGKCNKINDEDDLYMVALHFQLLRQRGHHVSCGKSLNCHFDHHFVTYSLYESAHLRVHEEDILDEALEFTTAHLEQMLNSLSSNTLSASLVVYALSMPIRKGLTRLDARHYFPIYQQDNSHNKTLLKFAKLDFNKLQKVHQRELGDIKR